MDVKCLECVVCKMITDLQVNFNTNPSEMPTTKEGYIEWIKWATQMVKEEAGLIPTEYRSESFFVGIMGLSGANYLI